jgi:hypothetical protein
VAPWCATALAFGLIFAPRATRFFAGILASVAASDFLQLAYLAAKEKTGGEKPIERFAAP